MALLGLTPAFGLPLMAPWANTYLAATVRIQEACGHAVVATGPSAFVRHPMYAGMSLFDLSLPLLPGSQCGVSVSAVMIGLLVVQTALEDRTLQAEHPGCRAFGARFRSRLLPGVG